MGELTSQGQTLTLAQVSEEHIKERDLDGPVGSSVVFNLAQDHLESDQQRKVGTRRDTRLMQTQTEER